MTKLQRTTTLSLLLWFSQIGVALAADPEKIKLESWFKGGLTLKQLIISTIPNFLISFVGFVFIVMFLVNAVRYLISAGNSEGTTAAKQGMLSAIIGIIVVLVSFGAVFVVNNWIGV